MKYLAAILLLTVRERNFNRAGTPYRDYPQRKTLDFYAFASLTVLLRHASTQKPQSLYFCDTFGLIATHIDSKDWTSVLLRHKMSQKG